MPKGHCGRCGGQLTIPFQTNVVWCRRCYQSEHRQDILDSPLSPGIAALINSDPTYLDRVSEVDIFSQEIGHV